MANKPKFYIKEQQSQSNKYKSLTIFDGGTEPDWLKEAFFTDAVVEITRMGSVTWKNGTWKNGTWKNGRWDWGVWKKGILLSCNMLNPITDQYEQINDSRKIKYYYSE